MVQVAHAATNNIPRGHKTVTHMLVVAIPMLKSNISQCIVNEMEKWQDVILHPVSF